MAPEPGGALTFLFADLESSTRLWERFPVAMKAAMERHDAILREAVERVGGTVVKTTGDGLMAAFSSASAATAAALAAQSGLQDEVWGETGPLRARIGLHSGEAQARADDYFGPPVNRAARIMAAAHGGQVLLSELTASLARTGGLTPDADLRDLGEHRLKDLLQPERIFQLVHPSLPGDFPPPVTLGQRPNNLPTQASELIGREMELPAIRELIASPGVRLLTLTGPGGIGKTRLALQAAADQIDRFDDGVYFVDLTAARARGAALEAIVRVVGVTAGSDEPLDDVLRNQLRDRHLLLVLDNFEQVMEAADDVADLLQHCPRLEVLVTSREGLRVRGEQLFPVAPLALPDIGTDRISAEAIADCDAVRLFVDRARSARPSFELTDANAGAVAEICARLDGLPLAIELAAARLRLFSPDELRDRLRSRLQLLRGGARDLPERQQTLRSTIEWSHELLDPDERAIFQLLSVFPSARVGAVEEVAAGVEPLREVDVLDRLESLVDKSLVRSIEGPRGLRLSMLETIRDYAAERLEQDPELDSAARRAHAEYYSGFAAERRGAQVGPGRQTALEDLAAEFGNLESAWRFWVDAADMAQLNRLLDALWILYDARGWYHAAIGLANDLLDVLSKAPASPDRVDEEITLRMGLARALLAVRGPTEEVEEIYRGALALSEAASDRPKPFPVLHSLATFHLYRAEMDKAAEFGRQILELGEQQDDSRLLLEGHLIVGTCSAFAGGLDAGLAHLGQALALFDPERYGSTRFRVGANPGVVIHTTSAFLLWLAGRPDTALQRAADGLALAERLNHPFTRAYALHHVAVLDVWAHRLERAHERAATVLRIAEEHDYPIWRALAFVIEGVTAAGMGRPEEGLARIDQGMALYQALRTPPVFWPLVLSLRARASALAGRDNDAIDLLEQALAYLPENDIMGATMLVERSELLLARGDSQAAASGLRLALDAAMATGTRMTQLRAATRLVQLAPGAEARAMLRRIFESFDEGFETVHLVDARAVLDEETAPAV
jgi:predicted ATPase/class 3 adenylate cyclase